ncbi:MAG: hypothetical protein LBC82_05320 [Oscillospiraceae bacterium]|jgi:hypothetical protein|nr:hypothetical protein [Oscillospiraceae bacterium]
MKKTAFHYCIISVVIFLLLTACNNYNCDICGDQHSRRSDVGGEASPLEYFELFALDSNDYLRIYVKSCWSRSVHSHYRSAFYSRHNISEMYEVISVAESNVPFEVEFDGETITLTTTILGLEEVLITSEQRDKGFTYRMKRNNE